MVIQTFIPGNFPLQALEEEFARQVAEQERFYSGAYQADVKGGYNYNTDSLPRRKTDNRLSTAM